MMDDRHIFVVIPTVGRSTLANAIRSVRRQTVQAERIIVVDDSPSGVVDLPYANDILVLRSFGQGPAAARNTGISVCPDRGWLALLDDDDEWEPTKLEVQVRATRTYPNAIISGGATLKWPSGRVSTRPRCSAPSNTSILDMFYGKRRLGGSSYFVPTPSLMIPLSLAKDVQFDETLKVREDIWWIHELQLAGAGLQQVPEQVVTINASTKRGSARDSLESQLDWADRLESYRVGMGRKFLTGMALRDSIVGGRPVDAVSLLRNAMVRP